MVIGDWNLIKKGFIRVVNCNRLIFTTYKLIDQFSNCNAVAVLALTFRKSSMFVKFSHKVISPIT